MGKKRRLRIVTEDLARIGEPGVVVVVDHDQADDLGACEETALSHADAWDSEPVPEDDERDALSSDEEACVTSLDGLEGVPVYSSTDELTGEVISGWGLRERDLRPDGLHGQLIDDGEDE